MSRQYTLESGLFGLCSGVWNEQTHSYDKANDTDIIKCCLNSCRPIIKHCREICDENYSNNGKTPRENKHALCHMVCNDIIKACEQTCSQTSPGMWGPNNPFWKSTEKHGCGGQKKVGFDIECIKNKKTEIIKDCKNICFSGIEKDCADHCQFSYDNAVNPDINPLRKIMIEDVSKKEKEKEIPFTILLYSGYAIAISAIFLGVYILLNFK